MLAMFDQFMRNPFLHWTLSFLNFTAAFAVGNWFNFIVGAICMGVGFFYYSEWKKGNQNGISK